MDLKSFLKKTFGKDLFGLSEDDLIREKIKIEKTVEKISMDIEDLQEQIQKLLLDSKGKGQTIKLLNVQKIKALRLECSAKQQEASSQLKLLQLVFLIDSMKERQKANQKSKLVDQLLNTDVEHLNNELMGTDILKAFEEGKVDKVKERLSAIFAKDELPVDIESQELLKTIDDLEKVDEEAAIQQAREKSRQISESPAKTKEKGA